MKPKLRLQRLVKLWRAKAKRLEEWHAYGPDLIFETEVTQRAHDMYLSMAAEVEKVIEKMD
jgi:hypothetical protein